MPVSYSIRGRSQHAATLSKNVSAGGLGLLSDEFVAPRTLLNLQFSVLQKFFSIYARTKWISSVPSSEKYYFGLEFLELQPKDQEYLSDYVKLQEGSI